jgi:putative effector of murein hydrolase LrgA (UPF0299 family)
MDKKYFYSVLFFIPLVALVMFYCDPLQSKFGLIFNAMCVGYTVSDLWFKKIVPFFLTRKQ